MIVSRGMSYCVNNYNPQRRTSAASWKHRLQSGSCEVGEMLLSSYVQDGAKNQADQPPPLCAPRHIKI